MLSISYFLDGRHEKVMFDKITSRVEKLCYSLNQEHVDPVSNRTVIACSEVRRSHEAANSLCSRFIVSSLARQKVVRGTRHWRSRDVLGPVLGEF